MKIVVKSPSNQLNHEDLSLYCKRISKTNNSLLYHLEDYLGKKLLSDEKLAAIRDIILTVSGDISRLSESVVIDGDDNEKLQ